MYFLFLWSLVLMTHGTIMLIKPRKHIQLRMRIARMTGNTAPGSLYKNERTRLFFVRFAGFFMFGMGVFTFFASLRALKFHF